MRIYNFTKIYHKTEFFNEFAFYCLAHNRIAEPVVQADEIVVSLNSRVSVFAPT